jgi:signal transduction histidine kinase
LQSRSRKISRVTSDTASRIAAHAPARFLPASAAGSTAQAGPTDEAVTGQRADPSAGPNRQPEDAPWAIHPGLAKADSAPPGNSSRRALKNWRLRSRLLLLVVIPTVTAIVLGGFRITSSVQSEQLLQRVQHLATLGQDSTALVQALEDERDHTAYYIALGANGGRASVLSASPQARAAMTSSQLGVQYAATDHFVSEVRGLARQTGSSYPAQTQQQATTVLVALDSLPSLRGVAADTEMPVLAVVTQYGQIIDALLALDDDIAQGVADPVLAQTVSMLGLVSEMKEEASQQRAILAAALAQGAFGPGELAALQSAVSAQQTNLQAFDDSASANQLELWNADVSASFGNQASADELMAISLATKAGGSGSLSSDPTTADDWYSTMANTIEYQMGPVQQQLVASVASRAAALRRNAITTAAEVAVVVLLILMLGILFTIVVGRSMVRPLRKLRTGALEVAGLRLPEMVRRMAETDGEGVSLDVVPIDVDSTDEIGEVARAFDQVHQEALRLAANEAALRGNVNAMFVNLSRRSQSLVERQIRLIDDLEQGEQDPERLSSLFQMDHLATRMRRNSENLLVLAGQDLSRRWNRPVTLVDVLRAALSEIERYERVTLNVQPGIAVRGQAVSDVVHLTAELVENATSFSAADTPVTIAGHLLGSGGVLLEIADQGVGMVADEMAHANWRLDNPPVVDVAVSRRMGLFVVARLAARHGIRVRLRHADTGGLVALVWLPDETITHETSDGTPGGHRNPVAEPGAGPVADGPFAGASGGTMTSGWGDLGRSSVEHEVNAARTPKFALLRADAEETSLGSKRVPGTGSRPGGAGWETTGPQPVFPTVPRSAPDSGSQPTITGPQPAITGPQPAITGPQPAISGGPVSGSGASVMRSEAQATDSPVAPFDTFATGPQPGAGGTEGLFGTGSYAVLGRSAAAWEAGLSRGGVVVPPAEGLGEDHRLPIFEAVESDWFRRGGRSVGRSGHEEQAISSNDAWVSPADEGWRAAEMVHAPSSGGVTPAGLPKRVPQANLVPGAAAAGAAASPALAPARSAAATRERFASFQRGVREGRAAAGQAGSDGGEDESSG